MKIETKIVPLSVFLMIMRGYDTEEPLHGWSFIENVNGHSFQHNGAKLASLTNNTP